MEVIGQPTIFVDNQTMTCDEVIKFKNGSDIEPLIRSHCTFFNFKLLEKLIGSLNYSAGEHMIEEYKKDFCEYVRAIAIPEHPHGGSGMNREDNYICVYLGESFKSCRAMYIDILIADICKILKIKEECLHIVTDYADYKGKNKKDSMIIMSVVTLHKLNSLASLLVTHFKLLW